MSKRNIRPLRSNVRLNVMFYKYLIPDSIREGVGNYCVPAVGK
jgi:hypothetical protein